jgi:hypothetical protein
VVTILLNYCGPKLAADGENKEMKAVIRDLIVIIGYFCANNRRNQVRVLPCPQRHTRVPLMNPAQCQRSDCKLLLITDRENARKWMWPRLMDTSPGKTRRPFHTHSARERAREFINFFHFVADSPNIKLFASSPDAMARCGANAITVNCIITINATI